MGIDLVFLSCHFQRLMKHTEAEHGDLSLLRRAEREIHEFALKIDAIQKETNEQASVTELISRKELVCEQGVARKSLGKPLKHILKHSKLMSKSNR